MKSYKAHYACFNCRKTFKRRLKEDLIDVGRSVYEAKCPECGGLTADMGLDFKSPKKEDVKKWEIIKNLYDVGTTFHSCGCSGPGYIPNSKEKLIEYFVKLKEKYLRNINLCRISNKKEVELRQVLSDSKKEIIKNQEEIIYWLEKVKQIEHKISLIR